MSWGSIIYQEEGREEEEDHMERSLGHGIQQIEFYRPSNVQCAITSHKPATMAWLATQATLKHLMVRCKTRLTQGRYTWRHNQVLRHLADTLERKRGFHQHPSYQQIAYVPTPTIVCSGGGKAEVKALTPWPGPTECSHGLADAGRLGSKAYFSPRDCNNHPTSRHSPMVQYIQAHLHHWANSSLGGCPGRRQGKANLFV